MFFIHFKYIFKTKSGYILIYFDVIFPIQLSEFLKSINYGSNKKKLQEKT